MRFQGLDTQVVSIFPVSVGFQHHFHTGLFVHVKIGSFPLEPTEGSTWMQESIGNRPGLQVLALQEKHLVFIQSLDIE